MDQWAQDLLAMGLGIVIGVCACPYGWQAARRMQGGVWSRYKFPWRHVGLDYWRK